ncbi:hypothetical protein FMEAI12_2310003 [Parafrankia sp. Ea1.12]|nr:hypothetical protein FMEAI12_2310003 [Parafrankia sp. Ea1.12]
MRMTLLRESGSVVGYGWPMIGILDSASMDDLRRWLRRRHFRFSSAAKCPKYSVCSSWRQMAERSRLDA